MQVTLHQLQLFQVVARHLSYTRAAEELFLTQPTVSMQIKQLTKSIGLPLFEQIGKRLYLTDAGRELLVTCEEISKQLARFEMTVADLQGLKKGSLRLAVVTTAKYFVPRLLGPFCQRYPNIDVSLKVTNRGRVLERLSANSEDLYILASPPENFEAEAQPFLADALVVLAPGDHPLSHQRNIPLERIAREPFLMREVGSGTRQTVQRIFDKYNLQPNVKMQIGSSEAIKQAIAGGLGISILSHHVLALEGGTDKLAILDVVGFPIRRQWHVVYAKGKALSVVARTFLEYLFSEGQQIAERTSTPMPEQLYSYLLAAEGVE
ncbi:LysR family transcriptional regulator [Gloeobacter kilaueensis]|uniref:LysR family transcriptional regulator n=1 Tax=Gloeobacter kilaueensis (strain ATCC BAA-2537 / CCAP 1431/1 / ULC 316 / JS1) TaxID=1183438 RepID=U5QMX2_GLOK1|nr:LysR family transcriptional regulator [Gloeobacter kilaueensis]AGY60253.1 LysR family transcriptional regulator [Gloeobacter kilaueensis JS1]